MRHKDNTINEQRFGFGKNWASFLEHLDEKRIREAENSFKRKTKLQRLNRPDIS